MACERHCAVAPDTPRYWDDVERALRRAARPRRRWPTPSWLRAPRDLGGYLVHTLLAVSLSSAVLGLIPELMQATSTPSATTLTRPGAKPPAPPTSLVEARALARAGGHDVVIVRAVVDDRADDGRILAFSRAHTVEEDLGSSRAPVVVVVGFAASPALY